MNDEDMGENCVTITCTQWKDLLKSIQSLTESNALLVKTIGFLLQQRSLDENGQGMLTQNPSDVDPYDLTALRRLMDCDE